MKKIEKHFYEHEHVGKDGQTTTRFFAKFTSWDRRPLTIALGDNLAKARAKLDRLHDLNRARVRVELDEDRQLREALELQQKQKDAARRGITFSQWAELYFNEVVPMENGVDCQTMDGIKRLSTIRGQKLRLKTLNQFFGDVALCDIAPDLINKFRRARSAEVSSATVNRGLSLLGYLLNLAADPDHAVLDAVPRIKKESEKGRARQQTISEHEYAAILSGMKREAQRVVIAWWETSMRHEEPLKLRWPMIDLRANLIRMPASITKERCDRRVPISWELRQVLVELKEERLKSGVRDHDFVFIRENGARIKDITRAWEFALKRAGITDRRPHDFRRTRISAWTDAGVQTEAVKWWSGHKDSSVHGNYVIVTDEMVIKQFREHGWLLPPSERKQKAVAG
jgi:integrase